MPPSPWRNAQNKSWLRWDATEVEPVFLLSPERYPPILPWWLDSLVRMETRLQVDGPGCYSAGPASSERGTRHGMTTHKHRNGNALLPVLCGLFWMKVVAIWSASTHGPPWCVPVWPVLPHVPEVTTTKLVLCISLPNWVRLPPVAPRHQSLGAWWMEGRRLASDSWRSVRSSWLLTSLLAAIEVTRNSLALCVEPVPPPGTGRPNGIQLASRHPSQHTSNLVWCERGLDNPLEWQAGPTTISEMPKALVRNLQGHLRLVSVDTSHDWTPQQEPLWSSLGCRDLPHHCFCPSRGMHLPPGPEFPPLPEWQNPHEGDLPLALPPAVVATGDPTLLAFSWTFASPAVRMELWAPHF